MKTNATIKELHLALEKINIRFRDNISFNRCDQTGNKVIFTLKAKSGQYGSRKSVSGRNMPKASWECHGYFFDALFEINPSCIVYSMGKKITINEGNWQEISIGSIVWPKEMSECTIADPFKVDEITTLMLN